MRVFQHLNLKKIKNLIPTSSSSPRVFPLRHVGSTLNVTSVLGPSIGGDCYGQSFHKTHPHLIANDELTSGIKFSEYFERRASVISSMPTNSIFVSALLLPSQPAAVFSNDVHWPYRQHSDLFWLSGLQEPGSLLLLVKGSAATEFKYILFVREKNALKEQWTGSVTGVKAAKLLFGADDVWSTESVTQMHDILAAVFAQVDNVYFDESVNPVWAKHVSTAADKLEKKHTFISAASLLAPKRLIKSSAELALMQSAVNISSQAFVEIMKQTKAGGTEAHLAVQFEVETRRSGSRNLAYPSIIASGVNALILHYVQNADVLRNGNLVLVDAGCEMQYYASDISRTFPVSGFFTAPQKDLYSAVLECQEHCIQLASSTGPHTLNSLNAAATHHLTGSLRQLGIIDSSKSIDECLELKLYKPFWPHSVSHCLGMDVHDTSVLGKDVPLPENSVFTMEPGLYIPSMPSVPVHFHNIGIRIEDDLVMRSHASPIDDSVFIYSPVHVLSSAPKTIRDIEECMSIR